MRLSAAHHLDNAAEFDLNQLWPYLSAQNLPQLSIKRTGGEGCGGIVPVGAIRVPLGMLLNSEGA
jgi:hypothetical protein